MASFLKVLVVSILMAMAGCAYNGKFTVYQPDMRFSKEKPIIFNSHDNLVSNKTIVSKCPFTGGNETFINPTVTKTRDTGEIQMLGFDIINYATYHSTYGMLNELGRIEEIAFLLNGTKPIVLPVKSGDVDWSDVPSYNEVSRSCSSTIFETGTAYLTIEQYREIITAESVAIRIEGSEGIGTYEAEDILESFFTNLKDFFNQYVLATPAFSQRPDGKSEL